MDSNKLNISYDNSIDILLKTIKELVVELHPSWPKTRQILQDNSLSKDLGLDSLARMELLVRMENILNTTFEEKIFIDAETPHDLWKAILQSGSTLTFVSRTEMEL